MIQRRIANSEHHDSLGALDATKGLTAAIPVQGRKNVK